MPNEVLSTCQICRKDGVCCHQSMGEDLANDERVIEIKVFNDNIIALVVSGGIEACQSSVNLDPKNRKQHVYSFILLLNKFYQQIAQEIESGNDQSDTSLSQGEILGQRSEQAVADVLNNQEWFPWIESAVIQKHGSLADQEGIDILVNVCYPVSEWINSPVIRIQVKSQPLGSGKFISKLNKKIKQYGIPSNLAEYWLKQRFVFLNGGGGEVGDAGVIGPFIIQICHIISVISCPQSVQLFLKELTPKVYKNYIEFEAQDLFNIQFTQIAAIFKQILELSNNGDNESNGSNGSNGHESNSQPDRMLVQNIEKPNKNGHGRRKNTPPINRNRGNGRGPH